MYNTIRPIIFKYIYKFFPKIIQKKSLLNFFILIYLLYFRKKIYLYLRYLKNYNKRLPLRKKRRNIKKNTLKIVYPRHMIFSYHNSCIPKHSYSFWNLFSHDYIINTLINFIMKDGKKYHAYKTIYKSLFFMKKVTGLSPLILLKKFLSKNRLLFGFKIFKFRKRYIKKAKLLNVKKQLTLSLKIIFNNFNLSKMKIKKKTMPLYMKISYIILNNLFNVKHFKKIIKSYSQKIEKNFWQISKEEYFSSYLSKKENKKKISLFKVKFKSKTSKMKYFIERKRKIKKLDYEMNAFRDQFIKRYSLNIQTKHKVKSKWS